MEPEDLPTVVRLFELCDQMGISRPLSKREIKIGIAALGRPKPPQGRPKKGILPSQREMQSWALANWFFSANQSGVTDELGEKWDDGTENWSLAYRQASLFSSETAQKRSPTTVKKHHLSVRSIYEDTPLDGPHDLQFWTELVECNGLTPPDRDLLLEQRYRDLRFIRGPDRL